MGKLANSAFVKDLSREENTYFNLAFTCKAFISNVIVWFYENTILTFKLRITEAQKMQLKVSLSPFPPLSTSSAERLTICFGV